jgi:2-C-methyl-D-erythritol 4-phosphate cytidylyltransferase
LQGLADKVALDDWVWVHDAARPCVRTEDLQRLRQRVESHPVGGLLALKMTDTVKQADDQEAVAATMDRSVLWRALTPQVFRYGLLLEALRRSLESGHRVTDEAQSMELAGHKPLLVEGSADNIKITSPGDLQVAELFLRRQDTGGASGRFTQ